MTCRTNGPEASQPDVIKACVKKVPHNSSSSNVFVLLLLVLCMGRSRVCGKYNWVKNNYLFRSIKGTTFQLAETIACPRKIIKVYGCCCCCWKVSFSSEMRTSENCTRYRSTRFHNSRSQFQMSYSHICDRTLVETSVHLSLARVRSKRTQRTLIHCLYDHSKFSIIKKTTQICECKQDTTTPRYRARKGPQLKQPKQYVAGLVTQVLHYRMSINLGGTGRWNYFIAANGRLIKLWDAYLLIA